MAIVFAVDADVAVCQIGDVSRLAHMPASADVPLGVLQVKDCSWLYSRV